MIIEFAKFVKLSPQSAQKVLCMCDECGALSYAVKQNIARSRAHNYTLCQPCARRAAQPHGCATYDDAWRESVRRGHKNRDYATYKLVKDRLNPDRELVARRERARRIIYSMLHTCLSRLGAKKAGCTFDLLGYSAEELVAHLEGLFDPGMSWDGRDAWHIDHRKPIAEFVAEGVTDPKVINALSNLRPRWKRENLAAGGKLGNAIRWV